MRSRIFVEALAKTTYKLTKIDSRDDRSKHHLPQNEGGMHPNVLFFSVCVQGGEALFVRRQFAFLWDVVRLFRGGFFDPGGGSMLMATRGEGATELPHITSGKINKLTTHPPRYLIIIPFFDQKVHILCMQNASNLATLPLTTPFAG